MTTWCGTPPSNHEELEPLAAACQRVVADFEILRRGVRSTQNAERIGFDIPRLHLPARVGCSDDEVDVRVLPGHLEQLSLDFDRRAVIFRAGVMGTYVQLAKKGAESHVGFPLFDTG